jgi:M6 family metalloprotease-like protein
MRVDGRRGAGRFSAIIGLVAMFFATGTLQAKAGQSSIAAGEPAAVGINVRQLQLDGELEVRVADYKHHSKTRYFLKLPGGRIALHFKRNPPTNLLTGAQVRIRGTRQQDGSVMLATGASVKGKPAPPPAPGAPSTPLPNTLGAQSTLVILVNFQDDPANQPYTVADAESAVFDTSNSFFLENSYQQTWLTGDVVGWFTIPVSSTNCDTSSIASYANSAAAAAGVKLSAYAHYLYAFPQNNACGWAGLSLIGGTPSQSWINGSSLNVHVIDHELGHALGLYHSHLLDCGTGATLGSSCSVVEYGDILDTMGGSQAASPDYNAFQKERLGWLNSGASPSITTVQSSGTYTLNAYELGGSGPNALKILRSTDPSTGAKTWYYIEARQAVGFDAFIANASSENETNGVLVHIGTDGDGNSGELLDMTPATPTYYWWFDPSLEVGQSFVDPTSGLTLTTAWVTPTEAAVSVDFTSNGAGSIAVATDQPSYGRGQSVAITATVTDGSGAVANDTVKFTITKANGAVVTGSANTKSNGLATYNLKLRRNDPAGTYLVSVAATIDGTSSSAATSFTVQ